jgi:cytochrome b subunit of formate dehydrogenase
MLFTSFVALRQIALHVIPATGAYGSPFLGLHLYTWSFIISMILLVVTTCMLSIDRQYYTVDLPTPKFRFLTSLLFIILLILGVMNIITIVQLYGLGLL